MTTVKKYKIYTIVILLIGISGSSAYTINVYLKNKHKDEAAKIKLLEQQKQAISDANQKIADLESKIDETNKKAESDKADLTSKLVAVQQQGKVVSSEDRLSSIISEWQPRIGLVQCAFMDGNGDTYISIGSSLLLGLVDGDGYIFQTNKHVISGDNGDYRLVCSVKIPGDREVAIDETRSASNGTDMSILVVQSPSVMISKYSSWIMTRACKSDPAIGDPVVVLGYPGIGSQEGITATEGIISGTEGWYFITSAKIDHGNSGGVAIDVKRDCYLGLPTYVESGQLESLGRILDWKALGVK